ncbi:MULTISPECIES: alanine--tRNA ligase [Lactobacillus]|jgi:alanine--tRNA ligase|uniref:alanine--tRNA ligase n=1 Tax=Lactobacillus TaxID=1578 RepID=UPI00019C78C7|nr:MULTISPECIES: alanine--tRNA ligase [Lactobacillus]EEU20460.1 alanyl-tRNA synthetase [Lactobacillus jensenii 27-2-CHN]EEX23471.1 alanine--tRNA ligase [Lactobacillus jensenii 115-3-CHN]EFH30486.1 alanine--tRNA ligase [Lactobacillus jensenii JV-V16]KAA9244724.1 alanine--tRNA ligase [Lactobacillus jensenii]KAA9367381.1 alanine--tRNA ligase [Lactobacillus jensenii]
MKKLTSSEFRQMYLDFFKEHGHMVLPSQSLIPQDDPTLLWINSGVATMKKYFDGSVVPKNRRITSSQKSIRTNDIENVGKTARHQTFFEMLGNFSVGDYFRDEAIPWAWEFLTSPKWLGLDKDKLFCTVYPKDVDSQKVWEKAGMPKDHIIKLEDNFWDIGEGPCGPDTEIFYDRGQENNDVAEDDPENFPGGENARYLEIWNIVFSQYNHLPNGEYVDQPHKNIDTGMGLERVLSILQDAPTNFETDLFLPMIHETEKMSAGKKYGANKEDDIAFKIIADHVRAVSFAIGDGALPSNSGRGYVLRRLIRRADLNGKRLGINGAFLYKLVPVVGKIMESHYPEVLKQASFIQKVIKNEEDRFGATLESGLSLLDDLIEKASASDDKTISGKDAFKLFDTYGFPYELTFEAAQDKGLKVDKAGFDKEMDAQKERARKARGDLQSMGRQDETLMNIKDKSEFEYGVYEEKHAKLIDIVVDDKLVDKADGETATLIFDKTPFYAERGGQVADHGDIYDQNGDLVAKVTDVQHAPNDQNLHFVDLVLPMEKGKEYVLKIDAHRREGLRHSHTATHLIHAALREVLGEHTHQAGSLVDPDFLRFDFTAIDPMTPREIETVERLVNQKIWENIDVKTTITDPETGKKMGALALFNGKYGDKVRVVQINDFSIEFCGGTHCSNTAQIGIFKIISEQAIGAGMRRIEAVTSEKAYEYLTNRDALLEEIKQEVKATKVEDIKTKITSLEEELHASQKKAAELESEINAAKASDIFENVQEVNGLKVIAAMADVNGMNDLRELADNWKASNKSDVLVLACANDGKANMVISLADAALDKGLKAGNLIKVAAPVFGGGGGGRPNMAQAGGKNPAGLKEAITAVINEINK